MYWEVISSASQPPLILSFIENAWKHNAGILGQILFDCLLWYPKRYQKIVVSDTQTNFYTKHLGANDLPNGFNHQLVVTSNDQGSSRVTHWNIWQVAFLSQHAFLLFLLMLLLLLLLLFLVQMNEEMASRMLMCFVLGEFFDFSSPEEWRCDCLVDAMGGRPERDPDEIRPLRFRSRSPPLEVERSERPITVFSSEPSPEVERSVKPIILSSPPGLWSHLCHHSPWGDQALNRNELAPRQLRIRMLDPWVFWFRNNLHKKRFGGLVTLLNFMLSGNLYCSTFTVCLTLARLNPAELLLNLLRRVARLGSFRIHGVKIPSQTLWHTSKRSVTVQKWWFHLLLLPGLFGRTVGATPIGPKAIFCGGSCRTHVCKFGSLMTELT